MSSHDLLVSVLHLLLLLNVREVLGLRNYWVPSIGRLDMLLGSEGHWWCHDLHREGDDLTFAGLSQALMLDKELEDVVNSNDSSMERGRNMGQHLVQILGHVVLCSL